MTAPMTARRADVCVLAVAELFRGDGEILANPIGPLPRVAGRLARAAIEPRLLLPDRDAFLLGTASGTEEGWNPYRRMFDVVWSGQRHVVMGATQIDRYGNQNIASIGDPAKPKRQLLGFRGAPGNTINHPTSYWVPRHSTRVFVPVVDVVCGIGYDRAAKLGPVAARFHEIRRVVSDLAVLDFDTPDRRMRLASVHPGVSVEDVLEATGFELVVPDDVPTTAVPDDEILCLLGELDPTGVRLAELEHVGER